MTTFIYLFIYFWVGGDHPVLLDGDGDVHNDDEDDNGNDDAATEVQTINSPGHKSS